MGLKVAADSGARTMEEREASRAWTSAGSAEPKKLLGGASGQWPAILGPHFVRTVLLGRRVEEGKPVRALLKMGKQQLTLAVIEPGPGASGWKKSRWQSVSSGPPWSTHC